MSEFSEYVLVQAPLESVVKAAQELDETAVIAPENGDWTLLIAEDSEEFCEKLPGLALRYVFAEDHVFCLQLYIDGKDTTTLLHGEDHKGTRSSFAPAAWRETNLLDAKTTEAMEAALHSDDWAETRDLAAKTFGFSVRTWLSARYLGIGTAPKGVDGMFKLLQALEELSKDTRLVRGGKEIPWRSEFAKLRDAQANDGEEDRKRLLRERNAENPNAKPKSPPKLNSKEWREIAEAVAAAPEVNETAPIDATSEKSLRDCASAREWLDTKKVINPKSLEEDDRRDLVDVIREGRFHGEGDRATVVREAAAMLLGRSLANLQASERRSWVIDHAANSSKGEAYLWKMVAKTAGVRLAE